MILADALPHEAGFPGDGVPSGEGLIDLLTRRRSIRRLRDGPLPAAALGRVLAAAHLAPAAYNRPPWHVAAIRERRGAFWSLVEAAFRDRLEGERLARYLGRLDGFRGGVGAVLVYEDRSVAAELPGSWGIGPDEARAFAEQALGMVQLTLWLAVVAEGLATSLQHWEALIEEPVAAFLALPTDRYRLAAVMPIGFPAEEPRPVERPDPDQVISVDGVAPGARHRSAPLSRGAEPTGSRPASWIG